LNCVTANDDFCGTSGFRSQVTFNAYSGTDYYIFVHGFQSGTSLSATGTFTMNVTCSALCLPLPANDECANAVALSLDAAATPGTNQCANASITANPTCESSFATLPDVWYSFVAGGPTHILTITAGTATNIGYGIYSGCGGTQVACNAAVTSGAANTITGLTAGTTYHIRLETQTAGDAGTFDIGVSTPCQPNGTRTVVPDCANNQFFLDVNVTSLGTSSTITIATDYAGDVEPVVNTTGTVQVGPYPNGTTVIVTLTHENGGACNLALSSATNNCPPPNDLCANAIALDCNSLVTGNTAAASSTGAPAMTCNETPPIDPYVNNSAPGVWYTVTGWGGQMTASLCGSSFDTQIGIFTGSCGTFTCVAGNDDKCSTQSSASWNSTAGTTYYIYVTAWSSSTTGAFTLQVSCGSTQSPCTTGNGLTLELQTDANSAQTSYEIIPLGMTAPVCSGTGFPSNATVTTDCCLPDGCYRLRVLDSAGDGITNGGYILRTTGTNQRIIDNRNNFTTGSVSAISGDQGFCLPIGTDRTIYTSCDKLDWVNNQFIVASENTAVSAEWVTGAPNSAQDPTSGYDFWFFDPNGSFSFVRQRRHNQSDGFGNVGATRTAHMQINNWALANHIPTGVLMNVRVRGVVNGDPLEWGPACRFKIDPVAAACPMTKLMDIPGNQFLSCGQYRQWANNSYAHARPVSGATQYQFRFQQPAEGYSVTRTTTSYFVKLFWTDAPPLVTGSQYLVDVRAFKNGQWCPWGDVCTLNIGTPVNGGGEQQSASIEEGASLTMWPNPNRGDQLFLSLSAIDENVLTITVDIHDLSGKRMMSRTIPTQGGYLNTVMDLEGEIAAGMYLVNITAGENLYTERLVVQP
jgi:hypothetical protein